MRPAIAVLATLATLVAAAPAAAHERLLAPSGRCAGAESPQAHHRTQRLAMQCLVRYARRHAGRPPVRESARLRRSATYKARRIAACGHFTHTPCGDELAAPFRRAGGQPPYLGEDLAWGLDDQALPRAIMAAWLASPGHRQVLLDHRFTHFGVRRRRMRLHGAPRGSVLWILHVGRLAPAGRP